MVTNEVTSSPSEGALRRARALRDEYARAAALYAYRIEQARMRARTAEAARWTAEYRRSTARCKALGEIIRRQPQAGRT